jgi:hypothetical protein
MPHKANNFIAFIFNIENGVEAIKTEIENLLVGQVI